MGFAVSSLLHVEIGNLTAMCPGFRNSGGAAAVQQLWHTTCTGYLWLRCF